MSNKGMKLPPRCKDEIGNVYGRLTVIDKASVRFDCQEWVCRCECGNISEVRGSHLRRGLTKSCGKGCREFCRRGHKFTADNTIERPIGRTCRTCSYEKQDKWNKSDPERYKRMMRAGGQRRRARKISQMGSWPIPEPEFIKLLLEVDPHCYYCRKDLYETGFHEEHKIPLSRPEMKPDHWEGLHDFRNVRLSCPSCNLRKSAKTAEQFIGDTQWIIPQAL